MRKKLYQLIEPGDGKVKVSDFYDYFMLAVITLSLIPLAFKESNVFFNVSDKICGAIFIVDYLLRWITADFRFGKKSVISFIRYPFSLMAIFDLISILPSLSVLNSGFRLMRILRLLKTLRVFKAFKYSKSFAIIIKVLQHSKESLVAVTTLSLAYIFISALVVFNAEPSSFGSFFDAVYWATVSLTTVGYGDLYPVTTVGRVIAMISSFLGIAIVALPAGIITAGYMNELKNDKKEDE